MPAPPRAPSVSSAMARPAASRSRSGCRTAAPPCVAHQFTTVQQIRSRSGVGNTFIRSDGAHGLGGDVDAEDVPRANRVVWWASV
jgi:hypothetical protein